MQFTTTQAEHGSVTINWTEGNMRGVIHDLQLPFGYRGGSEIHWELALAWCSHRIGVLARSAQMPDELLLYVCSAGGSRPTHIFSSHRHYGNDVDNYWRRGAAWTLERLVPHGW